MHPTFLKLLNGLHPKFEVLMRMSPCRCANLPKAMPKQGAYLFTENGNHLYIGRSNTIRARYGRDCNPGATHRIAAFAFKLAREATGKMTASYKSGEDSCKGLMLNPEFGAAFEAAKTASARWIFSSSRRPIRTPRPASKSTARSHSTPDITTSTRIKPAAGPSDRRCCDLYRFNAH
jgi:hypothetical protein